MHILELSVGVDLRSMGFSIIPAGAYLFDDIAAFQIGAFLLEQNRGIAKAWSFTQTRPIDRSKDYSGKKILVVRQGGFGDLLFLTPAIRETKEKWPQCQIHVACFDRFAGAFANNEDVTVVDYPVSAHKLSDYDAWVFLENTIEAGGRAETVHAVDLSAEAFGISSLSSGEMIYSVSEREVAWADGAYPRSSSPRLGVQISASAKTRDYPFLQLIQVVRQMEQKGWEIYLFGSPGQLRERSTKSVRNLTLDGLSFQQAMAVLNTCDVVLGPDSALIHVAGALGRQAVALYGPFPSDLRTRYARTVSPITERSGCPKAPCFFHGGPGTPFPKDGPCQKSGRCDALAAIEPKTIVERILYVYSRKRKAA